MSRADIYVSTFTGDETAMQGSLFAVRVMAFTNARRNPQRRYERSPGDCDEDNVLG